LLPNLAEHDHPQYDDESAGTVKKVSNESPRREGTPYYFADVQLNSAKCGSDKEGRNSIIKPFAKMLLLECLSAWGDDTDQNLPSMTSNFRRLIECD
jgi:hypothetical protein